MHANTTLLFVLTLAAAASAEERFVTIHKISGDRIAITTDSSGGGRGRRGGGAVGRARAAASSTTILRIPASVKVTTAMRERRTFEFRVGGEIAGGLKNRIFRQMRQPLPARLVSQGNRIIELNVVMPQIDINQSLTDASGNVVIAVRPKRPPQKRKK